MNNISYLIILTGLLFLGCGIKGPPLPPLETVEQNTVNKSAVTGSVEEKAKSDEAEKSSGTKKDAKK